MNDSLNIEKDERHWHNEIDAGRAGTEIESVTLKPDAAQLEWLARYFEVDAIRNLQADLHLKREQGGMVIYIHGHFAADIDQQCVVTLEPISTHIAEDFEAWYADPDQAVSFSKAKQQKELQRQHGEVPIIPEQDDPEPVINGKIDLADIVIQFVSLAINPYPVKEGASAPDSDIPEVKEPAPERKNPFAKLQEWKDKYGKE